MNLLQVEDELNEIVRLVGVDALSANERLTLETAKSIREDFLQQNAFLEIDWYSSYDRQGRMLQLILDYDQLCRNAIQRGANVQDLFEISMRESIGRAKSVDEEVYVENYRQIRQKMEEEIEAVIAKGGELL